MVSCSDMGSKEIRKSNDEGPGANGKATEPGDSTLKVCDKSLKRLTGPCHPLFWGSDSQDSAHQQAWIKAGGRDLVPLSEIGCSPQRGSTQSTLVKDMLETAFQVHAALA